MNAGRGRHILGVVTLATRPIKYDWHIFWAKSRFVREYDFIIANPLCSQQIPGGMGYTMRPIKNGRVWGGWISQYIWDITIIAHLDSPTQNNVVGWDNSVGIATRYGLDGPGSNPGGGEIFRTCLDRPWSPPSLLFNGYRVFPGGKAAGAWRWPPTPYSADVKERAELYTYSPLDLGGLLQGGLYQNSVKETVTRGSTHPRLVVRSRNVCGSPTKFTPQKRCAFYFCQRSINRLLLSKVL